MSREEIKPSCTLRPGMWSGDTPSSDQIPGELFGMKSRVLGRLETVSCRNGVIPALPQQGLSQGGGEKGREDQFLQAGPGDGHWGNVGL